VRESLYDESLSKDIGISFSNDGSSSHVPIHYMSPVRVAGSESHFGASGLQYPPHLPFPQQLNKYYYFKKIARLANDYERLRDADFSDKGLFQEIKTLVNDKQEYLRPFKDDAGNQAKPEQYIELCDYYSEKILPDIQKKCCSLNYGRIFNNLAECLIPGNTDISQWMQEEIKKNATSIAVASEDSSEGNEVGDESDFDSEEEARPTEKKKPAAKKQDEVEEEEDSNKYWLAIIPTSIAIVAGLVYYKKYWRK